MFSHAVLLYLTDLNGCNAFININLSEPAELQLTIDEIPEICGIGGEASIQVYGGTEPMSYSWLGPNSFTSNSSDLSSVESGNYELTINDANNCLITGNTIIESIEGPTCNFTVSSYEFMLSDEPINFFDNSIEIFEAIVSAFVFKS